MKKNKKKRSKEQMRRYNERMKAKIAKIFPERDMSDEEVDRVTGFGGKDYFLP